MNIARSAAARPLRIVILGTRGIPARYGGFETFAEQLSTRLCLRGHSVLVYGRNHPLGGWTEEEQFLGVSRRNAPTIFHKYLETPLHGLTSFLDLLFRPYDVALLCNAANAPFAWILKLQGRPLCINVDGIERNRGKWNALGKLWYLLGERAAVLFATRIVSDAEVIGEYYKESYKIDSTIIPYGTHPVVRSAGATLSNLDLLSKKYLLYVSRLERENNALGVIQAYTTLCTREPNALPLVIVGDAPYADDYKKELREAAEGYQVIFAGYQFGEAYEELQSNCYLYIQATEVGGTHPALIEAMSYGNCVVANGTPENIEVVGDAGVVYDKNDFEQLSDIFQRLLSNPVEVETLGERAQQRASVRYSWSAVVEQYEKLFDSLMENRKR